MILDIYVCGIVGPVSLIGTIAGVREQNMYDIVSKSSLNLLDISYPLSY